MSLNATKGKPNRIQLLPFLPGSLWGYAIGTSAAALLALYVAYYLQLDSPGSAMTTVVLVSNPLPGMVISKSIWRLVGTVIGVAMSIMLIAIAAQAPDLFILMFGLWVGLCTFAASYLRYFRAYGAVLAGYTLSLVALQAVDRPEQIFSISTTRLAMVTIGILSVGLVRSLVALRTGPERIRPALRSALRETGNFVADTLRGISDISTRRDAIASRLGALDPLVHAAANESARTAMRVPAIRLFVIHLLNITVPVGDIHRELNSTASLPSALAAMRDTICGLHRDLADADQLLDVSAAERITATKRLMSDGMAKLASELTLELMDKSRFDRLAHFSLAIHLEDLLEELSRARDLLVAIESGRGIRQITLITYHRDSQKAIVNGLRAFLAVLAGSVFWIITAWPNGPTMMTELVPVCALLATTERPDLGAISFLYGVLIAGAGAFTCEFGFLTEIDGFPLLAVNILVVVTLGALIQTIPRHTVGATAFLLFFSNFLSPTNPMRFDPAGMIDNIIAIIIGALFAFVAFRVVWPVVPANAACRLVHQLVGDLALLWRQRDVPSPHLWTSRTVDRIGRLSMRLAGSQHRASAIESALAVLQIGREIIRARELGARLPLPATVQAEFARMRIGARQLTAAPGRLAVVASNAANELVMVASSVGDGSAKTMTIPSDRNSKEPLSAANAGEVLRLAATLYVIAQLLTQNQAFISGTMPSSVGSVEYGVPTG